MTLPHFIFVNARLFQETSELGIWVKACMKDSSANDGNGQRWMAGLSFSNCSAIIVS